jgi:ABC-type multidrug transport system permease subunit
MSKFWLLLISFLLSEVLLAFAFAAIAQVYYKEIKGFDFKSILKGTFERIFLSIALIHDLPHALTFFSALKLATRLKHDDKNVNVDKYNDYYLIGNLASVTVAIFYCYAYCHFTEIHIFNKLVSG